MLSIVWLTIDNWSSPIPIKMRNFSVVFVTVWLFSSMKQERNKHRKNERRILSEVMRLFSDDPSTRSTWYHRLESPTSSVQPNKTLIINAAQRIWSELYMKKKPVWENDILLRSFRWVGFSLSRLWKRFWKWVSRNWSRKIKRLWLKSGKPNRPKSDGIFYWTIQFSVNLYLNQHWKFGRDLSKENWR